MGDPWKILASAGVPIGAPRPSPRRGPLDAAAVRRAIAQVGARPHRLQDPERVALYAWLQSFRTRWPTEFRRTLGRRGERLLQDLDGLDVDPNRYLKLRRIARENLAGRV